MKAKPNKCRHNLSITQPCATCADYFARGLHKNSMKQPMPIPQACGYVTTNGVCGHELVNGKCRFIYHNQ